MPEYYCKYCNFHTIIKTQLNTHHKTKKHINNKKKYEEENKESLNSPHFSSFSLPNSSFSLQNSSFSLPNSSFFLPNPHLSNDKNSGIKKINSNIKKKDFRCEYCNKSFSRSDNLHRHQERSCKMKKLKKLEDENKMKELEDENQKAKTIIQQSEQEKDKLCQQIEKLLEKVGTTHITNHTTNTLDNSTKINNQNINLNNFGEENLEMLTSKFMKSMIKYPFTAIPKIIKRTHFNDNHPENKNIRMLNKKDNKLQIRKNNKWEYVDKKDTLKQLISNNNEHLDKYYEDNNEKLEAIYQDRYIKFQEKFSSEDNSIFKDIGKVTELLFWNNM